MPVFKRTDQSKYYRNSAEEIRTIERGVVLITMASDVTSACDERILMSISSPCVVAVKILRV